MYSAIARQGYTHVIVLMIAECLSSANNLMRLAAEEHPELTVKVFDSKSASIGLGALAVQVARYAVRGVAFDPLCELTKRLIDDTVVYFRWIRWSTYSAAAALAAPQRWRGDFCRSNRF